jgi:hypothetical protein
MATLPFVKELSEIVEKSGFPIDDGNISGTFDKMTLALDLSTSSKRVLSSGIT